MIEKYSVGSKLKLGLDVPDLMDWIEKRVEKRSKEMMDLVFLPLVVAELSILMARKHWSYNEPIDEAVIAIRGGARELALKMWSDIKEDLK